MGLGAQKDLTPTGRIQKSPMMAGLMQKCTIDAIDPMNIGGKYVSPGKEWDDLCCLLDDPDGEKQGEYFYVIANMQRFQHGEEFVCFIWSKSWNFRGLFHYEVDIGTFEIAAFPTPNTGNFSIDS